MARSAMLFILIIGFSALFHRGAAEYQPQNMTDCLRAINALPNPLDPGSGLPNGHYVAPVQGMTILGDTCMIFCGMSPPTESGEALHPAIRPISVADKTTVVTRISTSSKSTTVRDTTKLVTSISTSSTSSSSSSTIVPETKTEFITTEMTVVPGPSDTMWIVGCNKPSSYWVVGGAHPSTVKTAPRSAVTSVVTVPPKPAPAPSKVAKRQKVALPTVPSMNAAVKLQPGSCVTLCPNAVIHSGVAIANPTTSMVEHGGKMKKQNAALIVLAIVLPLITTIAALVMGVMMLKYRRRTKVLGNVRTRDLEMDEGYRRTQK